MHFSVYLSALLLSPLSAFAGQPLASEKTSNLLPRDVMTPARSVMPANILARSPRPDSDDDECSNDQVKCGDACFPSSYNCCPNDFSGGCPSDKECRKRNDRYGCCDDDDDDHCRYDDDDGHSIFDKVDDFGDDVKDKWDDFWGNSGSNLNPDIGVLGGITGLAAVVSLFLM